MLFAGAKILCCIVNLQEELFIFFRDQMTAGMLLLVLYCYTAAAAALLEQIA